MTQPTFSDGPPVPLMVEGTLDAAGLGQLFADLATAATIVAVREKGSPTSYTHPEGLTLGAAADRLLGGAARAVQVRYLYAEQEWTDTILAAGAGFRVVRCRHDAPERRV